MLGRCGCSGRVVALESQQIPATHCQLGVFGGLGLRPKRETRQPPQTPTKQRRCGFTPWAASAYAASLFGPTAMCAERSRDTKVLRFASRSNQPWLLAVALPPANVGFCW